MSYNLFPSFHHILNHLLLILLLRNSCRQLYHLIQYMIKRILNSVRFLRSLLWVGFILRIIVYIFLPPANSDAHAEIVNYIAQNHSLPLTRQIFLACHPPLYYLLAQPFYFFDTPTELKHTQFLSLIFSCVNLYLIYNLLRKLPIPMLSKNLSFMLAVFSYTYLTYSLYVSNDPLSFMMGTWIISKVYDYIQDQSLKNERFLAILTGLALLTKTTFISFVPIILGVLILVRFRRKDSGLAILKALAGFSAIMLVLGSYKLLENWYYEGNPFVHNLDFFPLGGQDIYQGIKSVINFNLPNLIENPVFDEIHSSRHSYPLMLYATFWWSKHISFENGFELAAKTNFKYVGSVIYMLAFIPTLLLAHGGLLLCKKTFMVLKNYSLQKEETFKIDFFYITVFLLLLSSIGFTIAAGIKYDDWPFFHSRLFSHAFFGFVLMMAMSLEVISKKSNFFISVFAWIMILLSATFVFYFAGEIWAIVSGYSFT